MIRELHDHKVNPTNDALWVGSTDYPGSGGAHHSYTIDHQPTRFRSIIEFQNGAIGEVGINGVTHEALLTILADRLRSFQAGPFACKANACALTHIEEALHWLQQRTIERMRRGVEGTSVR